jgi:hypothetical protein
MSNNSDGVPAGARQLAGRLAEAFEQDRALAEQQTRAQHRLQAANGQLWSGLHPNALGLLYDDTACGPTRPCRRRGRPATRGWRHARAATGGPVRDLPVAIRRATRRGSTPRRWATPRLPTARLFVCSSICFELALRRAQRLDVLERLAQRLPRSHALLCCLLLTRPSRSWTRWSSWRTKPEWVLLQVL